MKLKVLFIIFNIVLILLLFTVFFLPLFYTEGSFMREFWKTNWFFGPIFFVLILFINVLFFKNRPLISYIESEDWSSLASYLEMRIFNRKRVTYKNSRLLTDTLLLLGDFASMDKFCSFLQEHTPKYLKKLAAKFAASKMISADYKGLFEFASALSFEKNITGEWMGLYAALALQMSKDYAQSAALFNKVSNTAKNALVLSLSTYFTVNVLEKYSMLTMEEINEKSLLVRSKINKEYTYEAWKNYVETEKQEIHVMILTKIIEDANSWLFF